MEIKFTPQALADLKYWRNTRNAKILARVKALLDDIAKTPHAGIGKPERLKYDLSGYWSRRITHEHRLVYGVENGVIIVLALRYHY